jgi:hypothetical protein
MRENDEEGYSGMTDELEDGEAEIMAFPCRACQKETRVRAPEGHKIVRTATADRGQKFRFTCEHCGEVNPVSAPPGHACVPTARDSRHADLGEVGRLFRRAYRETDVEAAARHYGASGSPRQIFDNFYRSPR